MKSKVFIVFLLLSLSAAGCNRNQAKTPLKPKTQGLPAAHSMKKTEERLLMRQAREDLKIIIDAGDSTAALEKGLSGVALKDMSGRIAADKAAGKIKVRRYDNLKLSLANYTKGIAGIAIVFTDNSYTTERGAKKILDKPTGEKVKLLLALKKIKGRWKIIEIFSNEVIKKPTK